MLLKAARDDQNKAQTGDIFDEEEIFCLKHLSKELEGQIQKQKNPFNQGELAWAAWIIA